MSDLEMEFHFTVEWAKDDAPWYRRLWAWMWSQKSRPEARLEPSSLTYGDEDEDAHTPSPHHAYPSRHYHPVLPDGTVGTAVHPDHTRCLTEGDLYTKAFTEIVEEILEARERRIRRDTVLTGSERSQP